MGRFPLLLGLAVLGLTLSACSDDGRAPDGETLVVYSAGPRPLAEHVTEAFAEREDVRVELFAATTGQVMARLEAERYRPRADVVIFASRVAAEALKADGRLLRYPDPGWLNETHGEWHDPDQYYFATSAALVGMAFHADDHDPSADWKSLFNGEIPGRFTMPSPSRSGAAGDFLVAYTLANGDEAFADFARARRAGLDFAAANSQAISTLLVGAFQGMVGAVDYLIYRQIAQGAPLVMHYPEGGSARVERPIVILRDTPVPDLARTFVDFYFSTEAQEAVAAMHLLPGRTDTAVSEVRGDTELPPLLDVDVGDALANQNRILRRFQIEIERAEVLRGKP